MGGRGVNWWGRGVNWWGGGVNDGGEGGEGGYMLIHTSLWCEWTVHVEIKYYMWQIQYRNWILIISLLISSASLSLTHYSTVLPQRINIWFLSRTATHIIVTCITEFPSSTTNSRFTQTCYVNTYINYTSVKQNGSPGEKLRSLITLLHSKCCSTEPLLRVGFIRVGMWIPLHYLKRVPPPPP